VTCTKVLRFSAGHRLMNHEGGCAQLHGHNYRAEITAAPAKLDGGTPAGLDAVGRVIDFSVIKAEVGGWIDATWDHAFLVRHDDRAALAALREFAQRAGLEQRIATFEENPTAENLARDLLRVSAALLRPYGVAVVRVVLWETDTCSAEVTA
jgi:6-pyruvoyltetrahydropterin/6-carboxytetrahydropterin synthase